MKVKVDKDACISCGGCVATAPEVFQFGDDDKAEAIMDKVPENLEEDAKEAIEGCPTEAIHEEN